MSVIVIGVDPGDSTGVAVIKDTKLIVAEQGEPHKSLLTLEIICSHYAEHDITIACERYVSARRTVVTHQPTAQKVIGMVERLAETYKANFIMQGPADAWAMAPNDLLKRLGMWQTSRTVDQPDANDANMAIRHAILAMANMHATTFELLVK